MPVKDSQSCGASIEEHIVDVWGGMAVAGVGGGCREVYKALVEIAEELRVRNNFAVHIPIGNGLVERVITVAIQKAEKHAAQVKQRAQLAAQSAKGQGGTLTDEEGNVVVFPSNLSSN